MAISHEQKMGVALRFVTEPRPYINKGNFIDAHLCDFQGGHLGFKFSERGGSKPGLGIYVRGHRQEVENTFAQVAIPPGFELNTQQQHVGKNDNGWIAFCKHDCANQNAVYTDIVEPGAGLDQWRLLFNALRQKITEKFGNVENCGDIQEGNNLPPTMTVPESASDSAGEVFDEGEDDEMTVVYPLNRIFFGAPGTGKSRKLDKQVQEEFVDGDADNRHVRYERVTFYPTYSYAQFVGTYKPVMKPKVNGAAGEEGIAYEFVPGPFLRVLVNALKEVPDPAADSKKKDWCLVIEEINRANAAAVFGDVFQLLDRKEGESEFPVAAAEDVKKYLKRESITDDGKHFLGVVKKKDDQGNETNEWDWDSCSLRIPENMYIWSTMNSADQGVFPMDTAFKRRWAFEYIGLDDAAGEDGEGTWIIGMDENKFAYKWEDFRKYVNRLLALAKVNEDKLMGPFFVKKPGDGVIPAPEFKSKVLMYLWEDAGKMCRRQLFGEIATYSELIDLWEENGIDIFSPSLREKDKSKDKPGMTRSARSLYGKLVPKAEEKPEQ